MSSFVFQRGNSVDRDSSARGGGEGGGVIRIFSYIQKVFLNIKLLSITISF